MRPTTIDDVIIIEDGVLDIQTSINNLRTKSMYVPSWEELAKDYYGKEHQIVSNPTLRPCEKIRKGKKNKVAKIVYEAERLSVRDTVQMAFTNPVCRVYNTSTVNGDTDTVKETQAEAIKKVYNSVRIDGENVNRMTAYFASCEIITIWFAEDVGYIHNEYGFPTRFKLRCRSYSPMPEKDSKITQADLYPVFDHNDNLISLSFQYSYTDYQYNGKQITTQYFETYTDRWHYQWVNSGSGWEQLDEVRPIYIGKIPGIYLRRPKPIWDGISTFRDEIEFLLSRQSDNITRNDKPIIVLKGSIPDGSTAPTGDYAREVFQVKDSGDVKMIAPAITSEASKTFLDSLDKKIREVTQMPDWSKEAISGSGVVSAAAMKTYLINPTLKIGGESHDILLAFDRECNIIKSFLGLLNVSWASTINDLEVTHEIVPFEFDERTQTIIDMANGVSAGVVSERTAIREIGLVNDVDGEINEIRQDEENRITVANQVDRLI